MAIWNAGWAGAFAGALLFACAAQAATRTSAFRVTATVAACCRIIAPPFAPTNPSIGIHCAPRTPYAVTVQPAPRERDAPHRFLVLVTY